VRRKRERHTEKREKERGKTKVRKEGEINKE
jgi:hypothetical protein